MKIHCCATNGRSGHDAAWGLLENAYREETGLPLPPVARTNMGKPYFTEGDSHFSLSHTKAHAFCVLAKGNVGLDAEELSRKINPKLAERLLSENELAQYRQAEDQNRALLTFWVLKEAHAKLSGKGLSQVMKKTDFSLRDPRVQEMEGCLVAVVTEDESQ